MAKSQSEKGPTSFLNLPLEIREKIYTLSGVRRVQPLDLLPNQCQSGDDCLSKHSYEVSRHDEGHQIDETRAIYDSSAHALSRQNPNLSREPEFPFSLLLVCKAVRNEVGKYAFALNKFNVSICTGSDVRGLRRLATRTYAVSCLKSLHIYSLPLSQNLAGRLLEKWWSMLRGLSRALPPLQLSLAVTYHVCDWDIGRQYLASLECLPQLRHCAVSMRHEHLKSRERRRRVVQATVQRLLSGGSKAEPALPFRFEDLPPEVRSMILHQTGLVQRKLAKADYGLIQLFSDGRLRMRHTCCKQCSQYSTCCCVWRSASFSSSCSCSPIPVALFQVSRQTRFLAQEVLLSQNLFVISGPPSLSPPSPMSLFTRMDRRQLGTVRRIGFRFSHYATDKSTAEAWDAATTFIRENMNLRQLELRVNILSRFPTEYLRLYSDSFTRLLQDYASMIDPLSKLAAGGLRRLLVSWEHLAHWNVSTDEAIMGSTYDLGKRQESPYAMESMCWSEEFLDYGYGPATDPRLINSVTQAARRVRPARRAMSEVQGE